LSCETSYSVSSTSDDTSELSELTLKLKLLLCLELQVLLLLLERLLSGEGRSGRNGIDGESSSTTSERGRIFEERSVLLLLLRERESVAVVG